MNGGFVALIVFLSLLGGGAIVGVTVFFFFQYKAISKLNASVDSLISMLKPFADQDLVNSFFPAIRHLVAHVPALTQAMNGTSTAFGLVAKTMFRAPAAEAFQHEPVAETPSDNDFMAPPGAEERLNPVQLATFLKGQGHDVPEDIEPPQEHIYRAEAEA